MGKRFESSFIGDNESEIFYQVWEADETCGTIVVTHGLAEHSECYDEFAQNLNQDNWTVVAWDLRGHGNSEGKRGYVANFDQFTTDLHLLLEQVKSEVHDSKNPLILFGHSLGGLITLKNILIYGDQHLAAVTLSSPLLGVAVEVPFWKKKVAEIAGQYLPKITLHNEIQYSDLVRDQNMIKVYESDPLRHDKISPQLFLGMQESCQFVLSKAQEIQVPLLLQIAGSDYIVNSESSKNFFDSVSSTDKKLIEYPDSYHEIFNDLDKKTVFADYKSFITEIKNKFKA